MGVFDFWKASSPADRRAEEVRSGARAPDRTERKRCWEARDGYFACLDRAGVLDAIKDDAAAAKACRAEGAQFERDCAAEWVTYFKKWRVADYNKKQRLAQLQAEGANKMEVETSPR